MSIDSFSRSRINIFAKNGEKPDERIVEIRSQLTDSAERRIKGSVVPRIPVNEKKAIIDAKRGFGNLHGDTNSGR